MKEIKFRAWDKHTNDKNLRMWEWDEFRYSYMNDIFDDNIDRFELMQYTGLKDKNGKEIYEGDIVKFGEDEILYEVYQHESGSWDAKGLSIWEWISENGEENEWEVVGNIYENPELLETCQ